MRLEEVFGKARWIGAEEKNVSPIIRSSFTLSNAPTNVKINIVGFGTYLLYVNGKRVSENYYQPLSSDFEPRDNFPTDEVLAHRIYVDSFDITDLLKEGKNTVAVIIGEGWYTLPERNKPYGDKKLIFRVFDGSGDILLSDTTAKYTESYVKDCYFVTHETQDYRGFSEDFFLPVFDDSAWKNTTYAKAPTDTEYCFSDCPRDKVTKKISPVRVGTVNGADIYDAGENISGFPVFKALTAGETVTVLFSEELDENGALDNKHHHRQKFTFTADKDGRIAFPAFIWYGFRYFSVVGNAEPVSVYKIHTDVKTDSAFDSDSELLNWIYKTFLNTQLCNMHMGVPSDCPHIERKGYTGDGQLCAHTVMLTLDTQRFYKKWIQDISDCQDRISGHVQYTAPYTQNGGGPGGWGIAIINVPLDYYLRYGDISEAEKLYPQMLRYFDFLDAHSENLLVTSDKAGQWCLGEWCTPGHVDVNCKLDERPDERFEAGAVVLPAPFVNNYFYIKGLTKVIELAKLIGKNEDIPALEKKLLERKAATNAAFFNTWDGNFLGNVQGANAFALDIGLGDERTKKNFIRYYQKNKYYDTGIFGTEIVTRLLFEYGEADAAFDLLTSEVPAHSFGYWKNTGATSFREYWGFARSHSHPMFGAVVAHFFDYILGITQEKDSAGYEKLLIKPAYVKKLNRASGYITLSDGRAEVSYIVKNGEFILTVNLPEKKAARVILPDGAEENIIGSAVLKCKI